MERISIDPAPSVSFVPINSGHVTKSVMYVNETSVPIYVTEPGGGHYAILPDSRYAPVNRIIVYVTYRAGRRYGSFSGLSENLLPPAEYRKVVHELTDVGESTLKYVIDGTDIAQLLRGDMLIVKPISVALTLQPIKMGQGVLDNRMTYANEFRLGVVVVQPYEDMLPKRWVRYYSALVETTPIQSLMYEPGIYLFVMGGNCVEERQIRFDFDDPLCPLRAFERKDEAVKWKWRNDLKSIDELQEKLKLLIKETETGLTDKKLEMELDYKRKIADLNYDKEALAMQSRSQEYEIKARAAVRDDAYDERSTVRKSSADALKVFPSLLALGATIIGLM
jgi:hypothetical protein